MNSVTRLRDNRNTLQGAVGHAGLGALYAGSAKKTAGLVLDFVNSIDTGGLPVVLVAAA